MWAAQIRQSKNDLRTIKFEAKKNIAKGTTDPGIDYFNQLLWFGLVGLV